MKNKKLLIIIFLALFSFVSIFRSNIDNVLAAVSLDIIFPTSGATATSTSWATDFSYIATDANQCSYSWGEKEYFGTFLDTVTMSANGQYMVAFDFSPDENFKQVFTSDDFGQSWIKSNDFGTTTDPWRDSDSSDDGSHVYAIGYNEDTSDSIFYSSDDFGVTWTSQEFNGGGESGRLKSLTTSGDGSEIYVASYWEGEIYKSNDYGVTWATSTFPTARSFKSIATSEDGSKLVLLSSATIGVFDGYYIYTSDDHGNTWATSTDAGVKYWTDSDLSRDGNIIYAIGSDSSNGLSKLYVSNDFGLNWATTTVPAGDLTDVKTSYNGEKAVVVTRENLIYTSSDFGVTWEEDDSFYTETGRYTYSLAISSDGDRVLLGQYYQGLYLSDDFAVSFLPIYFGFSFNEYNNLDSCSDDVPVPSAINEQKALSILASDGSENIIKNVSFTYLAPTIGAPDNIYSTAISSTTLMLNWDEPYHEPEFPIIGYSVGYKINSSLDDFTPWNHEGIATTTTISGLLPGTKYDFVVAAIAELLEGEAGNLTANTPSSDDLFDATDLIGQYDGNNSVATSSNINNNQETVNEFGLDYPYGLTVDKINHRLFVADTYNNRVLVYQLDSKNRIINYSADYVLGQTDFISNSIDVSISTMSSPKSLAYDSENEYLFVLDNGNNRILVFDLSDGITNGMDAYRVIGQPDFSASDPSTTENGMNSPHSLIYYENEALLFVSDAGNNRVLIFDLWDGINGITNGMNADRVLGQTDFVTSNARVSQNGMNYPTGMVFDENRSILFVSDYYNNRVLGFDFGGHWTNVVKNDIVNGMNADYLIGQEDFTSNSESVNASGLYGPGGLTYDSYNKKLFVTDSNNQRVLVYDISDTDDLDGPSYDIEADSVIGQGGLNENISYETSLHSILWGDNGMDFDPLTNTLFMADSGNNRVMLWDLIKLNNLTIPNIYVGDDFSLSLLSSVENSQGSVTFSVISGSLPTGLSLSADGEISGTPTIAGTYSPKIKAVDTMGTSQTFSDSKSFTFNVVAKPVSEGKPGGGSSGHSGGSSVSNVINNLISQGDLEKAEELMQKYPELFKRLIGSRIFFRKDLQFGMVDSDVLELQRFLNANGFIVSDKIGNPGSPGFETYYFGPATKRAVIDFQNKYSSEVLAPAGLTYGTGYFGFYSRKKANRLFFTSNLVK